MELTVVVVGILGAGVAGVSGRVLILKGRARGDRAHAGRVPLQPRDVSVEAGRARIVHRPLLERSRTRRATHQGEVQTRTGVPVDQGV